MAEIERDDYDEDESFSSDEYDDGYYEGEDSDREVLDFERNEDWELGEGDHWDEAIERNEDDGWFYDDDDKEDYERDGFHVDE